MAQGPRKKSRRIAISNKRQIAVSKEYYDYLEIEREVGVVPAKLSPGAK
ncbi:hypothetical protein [Salimicrobium salexigens]|uniref:YfhE-like protein n=1 Tax=Salimicrobium salexigens TaxID=908941 RepID=A0ABY1KVH3_9BACI|nr:hypothetical protein [Salimicrobium salexigens]SIS66105.1 hypothetical protein SAMN05421758_103241 [Salimicrobium salexigens]